MVATMVDTGFTARVSVADLVSALRFAKPAGSSPMFRRGVAAATFLVDDGQAFVEAFNYAEYRRALLTTDVTGEGRVSVDAAPLIAALGKMRGDAIVSLAGGQASITVGAASFTVPVLDADKVPASPVWGPTADMFAGPHDELADNIGRVVVAATKDKTLPILTAVRVESAAGRVAVMATDRYRLAELTLSAYTSDGAWTVPGRPLVDAIKAMPKRAWVRVEAATVGAHDQWTLVQTPGRTAGLLNIDGDFPAVRRLWPDDWQACITANTAALASAVATVASVTGRNMPIVLDANGDTLTVRTAEGNDTTLAVPVACQAVDEPVALAFNPSFLSDALASTFDATVTLAVTDTRKPVVIHSTTDTNYRHLLVPVRFAG